jgi:hypothetical protein
MKHFLLSSALLLSLYAFSQKSKVDEKNEKIGGGSNNALVVTIYENTEDNILKGWRSIMKDNDAKVTTKDGEQFSDNAVIKRVNGNNTMDVYAKTEKGKDGEVKFIVAFNLGGAFLNSKEHSQQFNEARKLLQEFADKLTKDAIEDQLKAAEKILGNMQDDQEDLVKKNKELKEDIEEYKEKIKKAEGDIVTNEELQKKKKTEIEGQQKVVEEIKKKKAAVE